MLELVFITSSRNKFNNIKYIASLFNIKLIRQSYYGASYEEPRSSDREYIIEKSIDDALERIGNKAKSKDILQGLDGLLETYYTRDEVNFGRLFIIEDTSVCIHALSSSKEYPGVDVKYWMENTSFLSLDAELLMHGNDRTAYVRSDIILYLNPSMRSALSIDNKYIAFTGITAGSVTCNEFEFETNLLYPWLDNQSFNKWFIPNGESLPMGMLDIETANKHDFRKKAFSNLIKFLSRKGFVNYHHLTPLSASQISLSFATTHKIVIVCGYPCSGKTTIGNILRDKYGYHHIEASDFMYLSMYNLHGCKAIDIGKFATLALKTDPAIVVDQIIFEIDKLGDQDIVITGLRSLREIEQFYHRYKGSAEIHLAFIEVDKTIRYNRSITRSRNDLLPSFDEFCERDNQQKEMGIDDILGYTDKVIINNEGSIDSFHNNFISTFNVIGETNTNATLPSKRPKELENAVLLALMYGNIDTDKYLTTTEIAKLINNVFKADNLKTSKNNISRYFNQYFYPYFEACKQNNRIRYRLSHTGMSLASKIRQKLCSNQAL